MSLRWQMKELNHSTPSWLLPHDSHNLTLPKEMTPLARFPWNSKEFPFVAHVPTQWYTDEVTLEFLSLLL